MQYIFFTLIFIEFPLISYYNSCIFSSAVSAIKCTKVGARDAVPTYEETVKFLKERGFDEFKEKLER